MGRASVIARRSSSAAAGTAALVSMALAGACASTNAPGATVAQVVLLPENVTVLPKGSQQFIAFGLSAQGDTLAITATYEATGGTITGAGLYTADTVPGQYFVRATDTPSGLKDSSVVVINPSAVLAKVEIRPKNATLQPAATQQFVAYGLSTQGDTMAVSITFTATGGSITSSGLYTAGSNVGQYWAYAAGGGFKDSAAVTISTSSGAACGGNAPAGATQVLDYAFSDFIDITKPTQTVGPWTIYYERSQGGNNYTYRDNTKFGDDPISPGYAWAWQYDTDFNPNASNTSGAPFFSQSFGPSFYACLVIKLSSPYTPAPSNGEKMLYIWTGNVNFIWKMSNSSFVDNQGTGIGGPYGHNLQSFDPYTHLGQWLTYELKMDAKNGTIDEWIQGTHTGHFTGVTGWPASWGQIEAYMGYGGAGSGPAQLQQKALGHLYVSQF